MIYVMPLSAAQTIQIEFRHQDCVLTLKTENDGEVLSSGKDFIDIENVIFLNP